MAITLASLRTPITEDEALATLIGYLSDVGFNATSWQTGSLQRLFLRLFAIVYADISALIAALADFAYNETATGDALTAFSASHYRNTRNPAVTTTGTMVLTNGGAVPYTIVASQLVVAYTEPSGTQRTYRNTTGGSLGANGGTLPLTWNSEGQGAAWNIPSSAALSLLTPLAGVTATNPVVVGTSSWITVQGADAEADDVLRLRNRTKWPTLAVEAIKDAVINVALNSAPAITRVGVDDSNPRGAGTVDVYIAGTTTTSGSSDVADAQAALNARLFGAATVRVFAAPVAPVNLVGTVYFDSKFDASVVQTAVESALQTFISSAPIGGFNFAPGPTNSVPKNDIENAIKDALVTGQRVVKTVVLSTPTADVPIPGFGVATRGIWTLTYQAVTA